MHHRLIQAVTVGGAASLLALSSLTGALAHSTVVDDGVIDSGKETHAHDLQHGEEHGHLPAEQNGPLTLLSRTTLKNVEPGKIADVGVLGTTAYLAAWGGQTCKYNGVHVVDIRDLSAPREIAFIPSKEGSYAGEGVQALTLSTPAFSGDVLVTNNEKCNETAGFGGVNIYDVTDPAHPTPLTVGFGDDVVPGAGKKDAHEIHSVFAWDAGDRAYAVLVDNEEGADVDILDITDPKAPTLVREYDLDAEFPQITDQLGTGASFLHDMVVERRADGRFVMLASYWDGGYVTLDVTDPAKATYLGDTDFPVHDPEMADNGALVAPEGNAHQAEYTADGKYIVAADEDFTPVTVTSRIAGGRTFTATVGDNAELQAGQTISGGTRFVGLACDAASVPAPGDLRIALVERGTCSFATKVQNAQDAGYTAAVVFNNVAECKGLLNMTLPGPDIPALFVGRDTGFELLGITGEPCVATPSGLSGKAGKAIDVRAFFDGWGYAHLYENENGKITELDTYAVPQAHDPDLARGVGDLSIHEVATSDKAPAVAYFSYYAAGLRVAEVRDGQLVETASFIDDHGSNFWGVEAFQVGGKEYVAASDRDRGLYLFEYTPVNTTRSKGGKR